MFFHLRQSRIETRPFWRGLGPDGRRRRRQIRIVKCSSTHQNQCRPLFRLAEHSRPASGAKTPVHGRPAVGLTHVVGERTGNVDVLRAEEGADRPGSSPEILADAAPAIACAERRLRSDLVAHRPAQTSPRDRQEKPLRSFRTYYEKSAVSASERAPQDLVSKPARQG